MKVSCDPASNSSWAPEAKKEMLGNVQMFSPKMHPGLTILGPPPVGRHKTYFLKCVDWEVSSYYFSILTYLSTVCSIFTCSCVHLNHWYPLLWGWLVTSSTISLKPLLTNSFKCSSLELCGMICCDTLSHKYILHIFHFCYNIEPFSNAFHWNWSGICAVIWLNKVLPCLMLWTTSTLQKRIHFFGPNSAEVHNSHCSQRLFLSQLCGFKV